MSSGPTFRMIGGKGLEAALKAFSRPLAKRIGQRALRRAAEPILDSWKAGTTVLTEHLRTSEIIGPDSRLNKRQRKMQRREGKSEVQIHVGTNDPAGRLEEFGSIHNAPQPALTAAWQSQGGQAAVDRIADELAADIDKTATRLGRR